VNALPGVFTGGSRRTKGKKSPRTGGNENNPLGKRKHHREENKLERGKYGVFWKTRMKRDPEKVSWNRETQDTNKGRVGKLVKRKGKSLSP